MSKMDGLRAMREARYAEATARAKAGAPGAKLPAPKKPTATAPVAKKAADKPPADAAEPAPDLALCGHRNMSGRTCTRELGHAAKSHRYS